MFKMHGLSIDVANRRIVTGVEAAICEGQSIAILGANGAGKSTLMAALSGERKLAKGFVTLQRQRMDAVELEQLARMRAVMLQQQTLSFDFSVIEYLLLARSCHDETQEQSMQHLSGVMDELDLRAFLERNVTQLSGGERQRIEFARAWLQVVDENGVRGKLLLLDEPTSALDIRQQQSFFNHLQRFCGAGGMVVCVLHDINQAARHVDKLLMLQGGRQLCFGSVANVFNDDTVQRCFDVQGQVIWPPKHQFPQFLTNQTIKDIA